MERLFSYGTLQYEAVQLANFGRTLQGVADTLFGFELAMLKITNTEAAVPCVEEEYPVIRYTGNTTDKIVGTLFELSPQELEQADIYEADDYKRIKVQLASGISAWVYVGAD